MKAHHRIERFGTSQEWVAAAAADFIKVGLEAVAARGAFHVVLPGGSTPRSVLEALSPERIGPEDGGSVADEAETLYRDWILKTHVYFGDERGVPPTDPDSNFQMVEEAWLERDAVPQRQIHRMEGERELKEAADSYNEVVCALLGPDGDRGKGGRLFDLVVLGLGPDGHTASLIPGVPLDYTAQPWVGVGPAPMSPAQVRRVTLTARALASTRATRFWVRGQGKAEVVAAAVTGTGLRTIVPEVLGPDSEVAWILDNDAASRLPS